MSPKSLMSHREEVWEPADLSGRPSRPADRRKPRPGESGYLDFLLSAFEAEHVTQSERNQLSCLHNRLPKGAAHPGDAIEAELLATFPSATLVQGDELSWTTVIEERRGVLQVRETDGEHHLAGRARSPSRPPSPGGRGAGYVTESEDATA